MLRVCIDFSDKIINLTKLNHSSMTSAKILFFFDVETLKILGHFVFLGTVSKVAISEDCENLVLEVENYRPIPWGDITPVQCDGAIKVSIPELMKRGCSRGFVGREIDFPCEPTNIQHLMEEEIAKIVNYVQEEFEKLEEHKEEFQMVNAYAMPFFVSSKYKS